MITINDTQVARYKSRMKQFEPKPEFSIELVTGRNYQDFEGDLRKIIHYLKLDLPDWDNSPTYGDVENRFVFHSKCFLFYHQEMYDKYGRKPIGWYWISDDVRFNFIDIDKTLPHGCCYGGNAFVTKQIKRPKKAGKYMYLTTSDFIFNQLGYDKLVAYVKGWNVKGIMTTLEAGSQVENWYNSWNLD